MDETVFQPDHDSSAVQEQVVDSVDLLNGLFNEEVNDLTENCDHTIAFPDLDLGDFEVTNAEFDNTWGRGTSKVNSFPDNANEMVAVVETETPSESADCQLELGHEFQDGSGEYDFLDRFNLNIYHDYLSEDSQAACSKDNTYQLMSWNDPSLLPTVETNFQLNEHDTSKDIKAQCLPSQIDIDQIFDPTTMGDGHQAPGVSCGEGPTGPMSQDWIMTGFNSPAPPAFSNDLMDQIPYHEHGEFSHGMDPLNSFHNQLEYTQCNGDLDNNLYMSSIFDTSNVDYPPLQTRHVPSVNSAPYQTQFSRVQTLQTQDSPRIIAGLRFPTFSLVPPRLDQDQLPNDVAMVDQSFAQSEISGFPSQLGGQVWSEPLLESKYIATRTPTDHIERRSVTTTRFDKGRNGRQKHRYNLRKRPPEWSAASDNGTVSFHYTIQGELDSSLRFTASEMLTFIRSHPLNSHFRADNPHFGLTLWIQVTPFNCGDRYPHRESNTCRFRDCAIRTKTIRKGQFRIAFDERLPGPPKDPFHNAGYVHLYCMEKLLDFPSICKQYNVRPDTRKLPYEYKNKMSIARDHPQMLTRVREFIRDSASGISRTSWKYEDSLTFILTREHMNRESSSRQSLRARRGGNHIAKWMGNLDLYAENHAKIQQEKLKKDT